MGEVNIKIQALGGCCKKSMQNYQNTIDAAKKCGIEESVDQIAEFINKHKT
ncbi:hypothetical protein IY230_01535 [Acholeplasma laidlawii]|uniref:hypothetical protein n=1 Tax=Acholeplasma laidlawii TaxID=2148 RepID=UPI0018C25E09|nr:hypothetical protein [Acholeplasma laidlawii]MBG0762291.1 hypothetical protein [Acholeplasma laidlawii]